MPAATALRRADGSAAICTCLAGFYGVDGAIALPWLWRVDGVPPTAWGLAGVGVALADMGIILWAAGRLEFMVARGSNTKEIENEAYIPGRLLRRIDGPRGTAGGGAGSRRCRRADLKAGRGMGLALAAELNGYPGPSHMLELVDALQLSGEQRTRTQALFEAMKAETIPIGERILAEETTLDRLFAERRVTQASLESTTARIATAQGELRFAHLRYHLAMVELLSPVQIALYTELRGYTGIGHRDHSTQ